MTQSRITIRPTPLKSVGSPARPSPKAGALAGGVESNSASGIFPFSSDPTPITGLRRGAASTDAETFGAKASVLSFAGVNSAVRP